MARTSVGIVMGSTSDWDVMQHDHALGPAQPDLRRVLVLGHALR